MYMRWQAAQYLEIRWWKHYLHSKGVSDYLAWKTEYWRAFLERHQLHVPPDATVLDAGCGPAGIFTILPNHEVTALDPLLNKYRDTLPHFDPVHYPNVQFVSGRIEELSDHERFDLIFCLNAINHVEDIEQSLDNLLRALRPGGQLALSVDVHNTSILKWLFRLFHIDVLHTHQHSLSDYKAMLAARNCSLTRVARHHRQFIFSYYLLNVTKP